MQSEEGVRGEPPPFPVVPDGHVLLFHGTDLANARRILAEGWRAPDPTAYRDELARRYEVDPSRIDIWYPRERFESGLASCTNAWRTAASYARAGAEFQHVIDGEIRELAGTPVDREVVPAVLILAVPWTIVQADSWSVMKPPERVAFLPELAPGDPEDLAWAAKRIMREVRIDGSIVRQSIVGLDLVADGCDCSYQFAPAEIRPRCPRCYLGSEPTAEASAPDAQ